MRAAVAAGCTVIGLPEDEGVEVPEGVVEISPRDSRHLAGARHVDVYEWFRAIQEMK